MSLQPNEVLIILIVALIVLGPTRLPGAIRAIGRTFRQVREFTTTVRQEVDAAVSPPKIAEGDPPKPQTDQDTTQASSQVSAQQAKQDGEA